MLACLVYSLASSSFYFRGETLPWLGELLDMFLLAPLRDGPGDTTSNSCEGDKFFDIIFLGEKA